MLHAVTKCQWLYSISLEDELRKMWKDMIIPFQHLLGGTEENHEKYQSG
jgi:hypothetical protein